jgi:hypothetical protein
MTAMRPNFRRYRKTWRIPLADAPPPLPRQEKPKLSQQATGIDIDSQQRPIRTAACDSNTINSTRKVSNFFGYRSFELR